MILSTADMETMALLGNEKGFPTWELWKWLSTSLAKKLGNNRSLWILTAFKIKTKQNKHIHILIPNWCGKRSDLTFFRLLKLLKYCHSYWYSCGVALTWKALRHERGWWKYETGKHQTFLSRLSFVALLLFKIPVLCILELVKKNLKGILYLGILREFGSQGKEDIKVLRCNFHWNH